MPAWFCLAIVLVIISGLWHIRFGKTAPRKMGQDESEPVKYISTRGQAPILTFEDALLAGLAADGGLYVPESWPRLSDGMLKSFIGAPFERVAVEVLHPFMGDDVPRDRLATMVEEAYAGFNHDDVAPLTDLGDGQYFLELYHGPTLAFGCRHAIIGAADG